MTDNAVIGLFMDKYPKLQSFYEEEQSILAYSGAPMTTFLFFSFVVADAIGKAIDENDHSFIKNILDDIERLFGENIANYSEIISNTVFENFSAEVTERELRRYFGVELEKLYVKFLSA